MTISFWRYSHLALAVSSFLFIALASVTGIILALEPVSQKIQPYRGDSFDELTVAQMIPALTAQYNDISEVNVDANQFVVLQGTDKNDEPVTVYVDPSNGKPLGIVSKQNKFFQWVTALHRSLFLHETGRFFIGLTAFLLFLIACSGTALIIQRQRGVKRFFSKIVRDGFAQYYHVILGRLSLIPIIIIALSGTIISLETFGVIGKYKTSKQVDFDALQTKPERKIADISIFQNTLLSEVKSIEFPFSEDVEDYYTLKLKDREITVNQITGDVLTEEQYPALQMLASLSMSLHTGRGSIVWAIILAVAAANILFFIYSGFVMTFKRRANRVKNKYKADQCEYIVLVGSENGSSFRFAKAVHEKIIASGQRSFLTELNQYTAFPKAKHMVVMTATYGLGDAPTNANRFKQLLETQPQTQPVHFSVLAFGSHAYDDFCKFGFEVNNVLSQQNWAIPLTEIHTVNDKSTSEFLLWAEVWSQQTGITLDFDNSKFESKPVQLQDMTVVAKKLFTHAEPYFILQLQPKRRVHVVSGDLLAIYPANDHRERLYSIGKVNGNIQLSVKLHEGGLGSTYLQGLNEGDTIQARIADNKHFHFPAHAPAVIMISNGTGIAPFLGMIDENTNGIDCRLYCGFRTADSFALYGQKLLEDKHAGKLRLLEVAYSREGKKQYVKDLLLQDADAIAIALAGKAVLMLCGSLRMQKDVLALLDEICLEKNSRGISYYQSHGQVLMDCY